MMDIFGWTADAKSNIERLRNLLLMVIYVIGGLIVPVVGMVCLE